MTRTSPATNRRTSSTRTSRVAGNSVSKQKNARVPVPIRLPSRFSLFFSLRRCYFALILFVLLSTSYCLYQIRMSLIDFDNPNDEWVIVGQTMERAGYRVKHPVLLVPGITSTPLAVWQRRNCSSLRPRETLWASMLMMKEALRDPHCWLDHLGLSSNWEDPVGVRLRPVLGFSSDYFLPVYWVWARVLDNLAAIGYSPSDCALLAYDWRLSPSAAARRDGFSALFVSEVERLVHATGQKVVIVSHSMGSLWAHWVIHRKGRGGAESWIARNVEAFVNVAGPLLGTPKALASVISGETADTTLFGGTVKWLVDNILLGQNRATSFFRSLGSLPSMWPYGPAAVWEQPIVQINVTHLMEAAEAYIKPQEPAVSPWSSWNQPDSAVWLDPPPEKASLLAAATALASWCKNSSLEAAVQCSSDGIVSIRAPSYAREIIRLFSPTRYTALLDQHWSVTSRLELDDAIPDNISLNTAAIPSIVPLPAIPTLRVFCMYGVLNGNTTEVGYRYVLDSRTGKPVIDVSYNEGGYSNGVLSGEGDGTVGHLSLGYLCAGPWRTPGDPRNPGHVPVIVREFSASESPSLLSQIRTFARSPNFDLSVMMDSLLRGADGRPAHVEILGCKDFVSDLLHIVAAPPEDVSIESQRFDGRPSMDHDVFVSDISEKAESYMKLDPLSPRYRGGSLTA